MRLIDPRQTVRMPLRLLRLTRTAFYMIRSQNYNPEPNGAYRAF